MLLFTAQDAPAKVMVTTPPVALAVAVQPVNPVPKVTVGVAGTVTFELNVAVMVLPAASLPLAEVVKPTLQVEEAWAAVDPGEKETALGAVGAAITTFEPGLTALVSSAVATLKVVLVRVCAPGLVIPAMVREAAVLLFTAQDAPAKVMVTTPPVALAVAVQPVNPVPKVTVGVAGTVTFELNVAVMVLPAASLPLGEVVKPMLQVEEALAVWGEPEKETALGAVAAAITTFEPGLTVVTSCEVAALKVVFVRVPAPGLVIPAMVREAAVLLFTAQDAAGQGDGHHAARRTGRGRAAGEPCPQGHRWSGRHGDV